MGEGSVPYYLYFFLGKGVLWGSRPTSLRSGAVACAGVTPTLIKVGRLLDKAEGCPEVHGACKGQSESEGKAPVCTFLWETVYGKDPDALFRGRERSAGRYGVICMLRSGSLFYFFFLFGVKCCYGWKVGGVSRKFIYFFEDLSLFSSRLSRVGFVTFQTIRRD